MSRERRREKDFDMTDVWRHTFILFFSRLMSLSFEEKENFSFSRSKTFNWLENIFTCVFVELTNEFVIRSHTYRIYSMCLSVNIVLMQEFSQGELEKFVKSRCYSLSNIDWMISNVFDMKFLMINIISTENDACASLLIDRID